MRALILLLAVCPIWAAPAFVQSSTGGQAGTSVTAATGSTTTTAGNTILVFDKNSTDCTQANGVPTITDTAGNTYLAWMMHQLDSNTNCQRGYIARNIIAHASNVVTSTTSGSSINRWITAIEVSGAASVTPRDVTVYGNTDSTVDTSVPCGPFTTIYADEIVVIGLYTIQAGSTWTAATGYTIPSNATSSDGQFTVQYKTYSATQSAISPAATQSIGARAACWGMSLSGVNVTGSGGNIGSVY